MWAGRVLSADRVRTVAGCVNVQWFGAKGSGLIGDVAVNDAAIAAAAVVATAENRGLYFPSDVGAYAYSVPPPARSGLAIVGDPGGTRLWATQAGPALPVDAGLVAGYVGLTIEDITISGNALSTHGLYLRGIHHSTIRNVNVLDVPGDALRWEHGVGNLIDTFRCSSNETPFTINPARGIHLTRRGAGGDWSTTTTILNPIIEGLIQAGGIGIELDYAFVTSILGGTSEGNDIGIRLSANGGRNWIGSIWLEQNATIDIDCSSSRNLFANITSSRLTRWNAGAFGNIVQGGRYEDLTNLSVYAQRYEGPQVDAVLTDALSSGCYWDPAAFAWVYLQPDLAVFADNATALAGGLVAGNLYRTATGAVQVVF